MRHFVFAFPLLILLAAACKPPRLAKRLPGTWLVEHYDAYAVAQDRSTGHEYDSAALISFTRGGRTARRSYRGRPHGGLTAYDGYRWKLQDSVLTISTAAGETAERWLVTHDLQYYLELVSVDPGRDTVRTLYLYR